MSTILFFALMVSQKLFVSAWRNDSTCSSVSLAGYVKILLSAEKKFTKKLSPTSFNSFKESLYFI